MKPLSVLTLLLVAACATPPPQPCGPDTPTGPLVWIIDYGWHTELIVPAAQLDGPLAPIQTLFPAARTVSFGFGKQGFMTLANPGIIDFISGTIPGAATLRVIPLPANPAQFYNSPITQIPLTTPQWTALSSFIAQAFAHTPDGNLIPIPGESQGGSRFYAATHRYSLAYTCNTWSIDALHQAGLPLGTSVVFSGGAMGEVAHLSTACRPG